jgi:hypothetical protein
VYLADAACQALVPVSRSAGKSAAPAESGVAAAMRTPVKHKAGNLISPLFRHPRAPVALRQGQASKRQASHKSN